MKVTINRWLSARQSAGCMEYHHRYHHAADYGGIEKQRSYPACRRYQWTTLAGNRIYFVKPATVEKWITKQSTTNTMKPGPETESSCGATMTIEEGEKAWTIAHETKARGFVARLKSLPMIFFKGMLKSHPERPWDIKQQQKRRC